MYEVCSINAQTKNEDHNFTEIMLGPIDIPASLATSFTVNRQSFLILLEQEQWYHQLTVRKVDRRPGHWGYFQLRSSLL